MQQYRTLEDLNNLNGKVVMLRADLNVPMDENFNVTNKWWLFPTSVVLKAKVI